MDINVQPGIREQVLFVIIGYRRVHIKRHACFGDIRTPLNRGVSTRYVVDT